MNLSPGKSWACFLDALSVNGMVQAALFVIFRGFLDFRQTVMIP